MLGLYFPNSWQHTRRLAITAFYVESQIVVVFSIRIFLWGRGQPYLHAVVVGMIIFVLLRKWLVLSEICVA